MVFRYQNVSAVVAEYYARSTGSPEKISMRQKMENSKTQERPKAVFRR